MPHAKGSPSRSGASASSNGSDKLAPAQARSALQDSLHIVDPARSLEELHKKVVSCTRCTRLISYCQEIGRVKRRAYLDWEYWAKPVPGFGDPNARVLILGLAPGAHGSNRTGRPFTGDGSGYFMYPVLNQTGFASQANATHRDDGMTLTDAYITAVVRCAPPGNKPLPEEIANCAPFLDIEISALKNVKVVVALGKIGFDGYLNYLRRCRVITTRAPYQFGHGVEYAMPNGVALLGTYHPSMQNTNTGKLTETMFRRVFERARELAETRSPWSHGGTEKNW